MRTRSFPVLPVALAASIAGAILPAAPAHAQSTVTPAQKDQVIAELKGEIKSLEKRVEALEGLDQKVRVIDRKLEVQSEAAVATAREMPTVEVGARGVTFASADKDYQLAFHGIIQGDARFFTTGNDKTPTGSTFYMNRVRPILTGTLWKSYDFNITPDFGLGRAVLQDGYIDDKYFEEAQLMAGKFKAPFGLERLQSDRDLEFSERALTNNLVPNRDIGAEIHSDLFDQRLTYQLALMNGVPNNTATVDNDSNDGKDFLGRVFTTPFKQSDYQWTRGIGFGFSGSYGDERNGTTSVYKTYGQTTWFSYNKGVTAAGTRYRYSPQGYYYWGPFGLTTEFVSDTHQLNRNIKFKKNGAGKYVNNYATFTDRGYMITGSYVLTGEDSSYDGVKPYRPFEPRNGTWGAFEVAARISNLATDSGQFKLNFADPSVSARTATEYAFGLNWYLSQNIKWQAAYARTFFDLGAAGGKDRPDEGVFETQLQLSF